MRLLSFILAASLLLPSFLQAKDAETGEKIMVAYDFDYEFFMILGRIWEAVHETKTARINPYGLMSVSGMEIEKGETFIHENIGRKSIIFFKASPARHEQFRKTYKQIMRKPILEISEARIKILRATN